MKSKLRRSRCVNFLVPRLVGLLCVFLLLIYLRLMERLAIELWPLADGFSLLPWAISRLAEARLFLAPTRHFSLRFL